MVKKSKDVLDVSAKRKKKLLPAVVKSAKLSKLKDVGGMSSILGDSVEEIMQMLERRDTDNATTLMQRKLMQVVVDMIPYAEKSIRESEGKKGVYQLNSLITSLRELMIDVQATKDRGALGDAMVEKIIRPTFLDIGMRLVLEDEKALKEIKDEVDLETYKQMKKIHAQSLQNMASFIQDKYAEAKQNAISFLQQ
jgi:hypothetical protein